MALGEVGDPLIEDHPTKKGYFISDIWFGDVNEIPNSWDIYKFVWLRMDP